MAYIKYFLLLLLAMPAKAQLFGQAKAQKNYYLRQIAAYNALQVQLQQGYKVMKHGLNGISDISGEEMNAHSTYYTSLKTPSSAVKTNPQVKDILNYQSYIKSAFSQPFDLKPDEYIYVANVKSNLFAACDKDLEDLQNLLGSQLQMTDDERLKRLNTIHAAMLDKYQFSQSFTNSLKILAIRRQQNQHGTQTLRSLYENH